MTIFIPFLLVFLELQSQCLQQQEETFSELLENHHAISSPAQRELQFEYYIKLVVLVMFQVHKSLNSALIPFPPFQKQLKLPRDDNKVSKIGT